MVDSKDCFLTIQECMRGRVYADNGEIVVQVEVVLITLLLSPVPFSLGKDRLGTGLVPV
jgi:hypothetical protein